MATSPLTLASSIPWYELSILGPYSIPITTLTGVATTILAADDARTGVWFHNPGSEIKRIMPAGTGLALVAGAGGIPIYPQTDYYLLKHPTSPFNINCAWVAVTDNNSDPALTILNFTPNTPGAAAVRPTMRVQQQIPVASPVGSQTLNIGTGSVPILAADPNRNGVIFTNPSAVEIGVCPDNTSASIGAGSIILLPSQTKQIIGNNIVKVNCGWNAAAASGASNIMTALGLYG